ncbi:hypothetical protein ABET51_08920 [Metabacillus fastidiosus]|uniref:MotE family protein n=1 Tax=Metabacillus fastidiosus TaxID=1458 RepID=UPI002E209725|nr:hypothetical protein [Metabacillus fastidiosus]
MENEGKRTSKFQMFLFLIFIPLIFLIIIVYSVLTFAGFSPVEKTMNFAKTIPYVGDYLKPKEEKEKQTEEDKLANVQEDFKKEKKKLKETIEKQKTELKKLETDVTTKETEIQRLTQEVSSLEEQLETVEEKEKTAKSKDIAKVYSAMSSGKAAELIPNLSTDEAMYILTSLKDKQVTDILSKMSTEDAVKYTKMLNEQNG